MAQKSTASVNKLSLAHARGTYLISDLLTRLLLKRRAQERDSRRSELRGCLTTGRLRAPHSSSPIRPVPTLIRPPTLPSPPLSVPNLPFRQYECVTSYRSLRTNPKSLFHKAIEHTRDKRVKRSSLHLCRKIICQRIGACRYKGETQEVRKRACACSGQSLRLTT